MIFRQRNIVQDNFPGRAEVENAYADCFAKAKRLKPDFTLNIEDVPLVFFKNSRTAGWAKARYIEGKLAFNLEINAYLAENNTSEIINDTIPHEIAHIVEIFVNGNKSHDKRWQKTAEALGSQAKRLHKMEVKGRRQRRYIYKSDCGKEIKVSPQLHAKMKKGQAYTYKNVEGEVNISHFTNKHIVE